MAGLALQATFGFLVLKTTPGRWFFAGVGDVVNGLLSFNAKGADFVALRIRQIAAATRVPIVERRELARAMYDVVEVGQEVPEQFYQAIAEILAYVYELSGRGVGPRAGSVA